MKETVTDLQEQLKKAGEDQQPILSFLLQISFDLIAELESIRPAEKRRQSIMEEKLKETPRKSFIPSLKSPIKKKAVNLEVSDDTVKKVHLAIEKDKNLQYLVDTKQVVYFDRIATCVQIVDNCF